MATPDPRARTFAQSAMTRRRFLGAAAIFGASAALALSGCSQAAEEPSASASAATDSSGEAASASQAVAVVYFSLPETDRTENLTEDEENSVVVVDGRALGNTQYVAQLIADQTGGELIRLQPAEPYTTVHADLVDQALEEQNQDARPQLSEMPDLSAYDTVFFGYPIWWSDLPMVCYTFLESADFSGKQVILFNTHGGSRDARTMGSISSILTNAQVSEDNFVASRNAVADCAGDVTAWLSGHGF